VELGRHAAARGYRLRHVHECASTNDLASADIREGGERIWIVADRQLAGRGRLGREWIARDGNLYASLCLRNPASPRVAPQIGFVAAVAIFDAAGAILGAAERLSIKWPNDLLLDGAKTAGILAESASLSNGDFGVVVGIGVNVAEHPEGTPYPSAHLAQARPTVTAPQLFAELSDAFAQWFEEWRARGFEPIREAWTRRAAGLGRAIKVRRVEGDLDGVCEGLDGEGRLIVSAPQGRYAIDAGDVFLMR
jgi:BirA family biotin operon repressor/biotin-[acetyl-CoA-carboxylase] ligase